MKRLWTLFQMEGADGQDLGQYGTGDVRKLEDFYVFAGIDPRGAANEKVAARGDSCGDLVWVPWSELQSLRLEEGRLAFDSILRPGHLTRIGEAEEVRFMRVPMRYPRDPDAPGDARFLASGVMLEEKPGGLHVAHGWRTVALETEDGDAVVPLSGLVSLEWEMSS